MASPTLDDIPYRVDVLEEVLSVKAMPHHFVEDPLKAITIGCDISKFATGDKEQYATLLNVSPTCTHGQCPNEVLNVEFQDSKEKGKSFSKVDLKLLPPHLRYVSLTLIISSMLLLVLNWMART